MKKMKKVLLLFAVVLSLGAMVGCTDIESGTKEIASAESEYTADLMKQINDEIGMPEITEFYEKKLAKEVLELRDDSKLVCYAYTYSPYTGKFIYLGKSIGYGIPYVNHQFFLLIINVDGMSCNATFSVLESLFHA